VKRLSNEAIQGLRERIETNQLTYGEGLERKYSIADDYIQHHSSRYQPHAPHENCGGLRQWRGRRICKNAL
jgi:hypothetical protein